ncbi:CYTH domain-containing protein [Halomonas mongoliensis]|uniref:CYTH domain-containing protein n=1 Tax=Halomonas mongoliensis TaxID=321265 RepID=UPI00403AA5C7
MSHEIELKLALGPEGPDALRRHPLLAEQAPAAQRLGNTYFDTPEGDLEAARMALRLRRIDGRTLQTVKTSGEGGGGLSRRGEWEWEVPGPELDLAGLAGLPPATLGREVLSRLRPRFTTDFRRESWQLAHAGARIEVALDEGEILADGRRVAIRELELELKAGEPEALWSLAEALAESVPLRPADTSKAARGGALLRGTWKLPEGVAPSAWLQRAVVALDALADTGEAHWREAARDALGGLAEASGGELGEAARRLAEGLNRADWLAPPFGLDFLRLARRLPADRPLG